MKSHESPLESVACEVEEKIGMKIVNSKLRGILPFPLKNKVAANSLDYWVTFLYTCDKWEGNISNECNEGEIMWVENDKIVTLNLWEGDKIFLKQLEKDKRFFILDLVYDGSNLEDHILRFVE